MPFNVVSFNVTPFNVAPCNVAPFNVAPCNVAPCNVARFNVAPSNVAPFNVPLNRLIAVVLIITCNSLLCFTKRCKPPVNSECPQHIAGTHKRNPTEFTERLLPFNSAAFVFHSAAWKRGVHNKSVLLFVALFRCERTCAEGFRPVEDRQTEINSELEKITQWKTHWFTIILICFVCTGVRTTATEWQLNCSK